MIFTFGHSTLDPETALEFIGKMDILADVRSHQSSRWEWWNAAHMDWIPEAGIDLQWWPELGGWNEKDLERDPEWYADREVKIGEYVKGFFPLHHIASQREVPEGTRGWTSVGLHDYSWYTSTPDFLAGVQNLRKVGADQDIAIMCAEFAPHRCHRSMISDCLVYLGENVVHLQPKKHTHISWRTLDDRWARYDPEIIAAWRTLK